jgi:RHS repeat-associated protein
MPSPGGSRYGYCGAWGYESGGGGANDGQLWGDDQAHDPGLVHVGARWYEPATGRFIQRDPIGIQGGLNVYGYVENSPLDSIDPEGLDGVEYRFRTYIDRPNMEGRPEEARENARAQAIGAGIGLGCLGLGGGIYGVATGTIRIGPGWVAIGAAQKSIRLAFGGRKMWMHGHIHAGNIFRPWRWVQKFGNWKRYD